MFASAATAWSSRPFDCELEEIEQTGQARVSIGGRPFSIRKEWPLEAVFAQLSYQKVKMEELGQGTDIQIELTFTGDLDSEQEARLVEMAHRCPVHRTLIGPIRVRINL